MATLEIEITGLKELVEGTDEVAKSYLAKTLQKHMLKAAAEVQKTAKKEVPVDTSNLQSSIQILQSFSSPFEFSVKPLAKYASDVEFGTSPHFVPLSQLKGWAGRHGFTPGAIQAHIMRKGTKANPFMDRTFVKSESRVRYIIDEVPLLVAQRMIGRRFPKA